jgi:hypothetical protein
MLQPVPCYTPYHATPLINVMDIRLTPTLTPTLTLTLGPYKQVTLSHVMDIRAFELERALDLDPDFLQHGELH